MNAAIKLIQPVQVKRDANGEWWHPDLPIFAGTDEADENSPEWEAWLADQGLETARFALESEPDTHPTYIRIFDECGNDFSDWHPQPNGDGWFLLAIGDTEDGPCATFVRRANQEKAS